MDMNNTTSDKNVAQDIEYLKSNEADALYFRGNPRLKSAVESVLEKIEELEKENKRKQTLLACAGEVIENNIPTQKVIDKIEELENAKRETTKENWYYIYTIQIKILQELLGESK